MPTPILIVDDSPIARKMLIKSLPSSWDVEIKHAGNGQEALDAHRAGKIDIMFLDLTMPVLDGYEVLEAMQKEGLNSFVIVLSADIQPIAQERVKKLGAMAFIKKPASPEVIGSVLKQFEVLHNVHPKKTLRADL
jgi:CheY-like chemotaxis protein